MSESLKHISSKEFRGTIQTFLEQLQNISEWPASQVSLQEESLGIIFNQAKQLINIISPTDRGISSSIDNPDNPFIIDKFYAARFKSFPLSNFNAKNPLDKGLYRLQKRGMLTQQDGKIILFAAQYGPDPTYNFQLFQSAQIAQITRRVKDKDGSDKFIRRYKGIFIKGTCFVEKHQPIEFLMADEPRTICFKLQ